MFGYVLRRNSTAGVTDNHAGVVLSRTDLDPHHARALHGLDRVQEQIQKYLVNLIAIVLDFGLEVRSRIGFDRRRRICDWAQANLFYPRRSLATSIDNTRLVGFVW